MFRLRATVQAASLNGEDPAVFSAGCRRVAGIAGATTICEGSQPGTPMPPQIPRVNEKSPHERAPTGEAQRHSGAA